MVPPLYLTTSSVSSHVLMQNLRRRRTKAIFPAISANLDPMQLRGPTEIRNDEELSAQIRELKDRLDESAKSLKSLSVKYDKDIDAANQNNLKLQVNDKS